MWLEGVRSFPVRALALACAALACGCANYPSHIAPGMTRAEVVQRFGEPSVDTNTPSGELMIYATGPMGQFAYAARFGPSGQVDAVDQVLTPRHFARIRRDEWTKADILENFGPPAARRTIRDHETWDYRYKEDDVYNSLFTITFDEAGVVAKTENGPDLLGDGGRMGHRR